MITLADLKAFLRIPTADTTNDAALTLIVGGVNSTLLKVFGGLSAVAVTSYTDRITVGDSSTSALWLRRWPVVAITSVVEDGDTLASSLYAFDGEIGMLRLVQQGRWFSCGRDSVVVTYTAGWAGAVDGDLVLAGVLMGAHAWNTGPRAGLSSERIGQYGYKLAGGSAAGQDAAGGFGIPPEAERILSNYRRAVQVWPN